MATKIKTSAGYETAAQTVARIKKALSNSSSSKSSTSSSKSSSGGSSTRVKTSAGYETADQTVARAKAMLGSAYNPNTKAPSQSRLDEIANQSFIDPSVKTAYNLTRPGGPAPSQSTPYQGTGNPTPPVWATAPAASGIGAEQLGQSPALPSNVAPAQQALLQALQTTGAEQSVQTEQQKAEQELRNLQRGQDQTNKNIADQPIAKPFITGQQAAVAQQYGIDRGAVNDRMLTLQAKLANLQAQRQSSIDVAKTRLDFAKYQDSQAQQQFQNQATLAQQQLAYQQYQDKLKQQEYENTTSAAQQAFDNQIAQQQQARLASSGSSSENKETAAFQADAAKFIEQLGSNKVSWGTAFNALKAKYPQASNELIDVTLGKDRYYTVQGNAEQGRTY